MNILFVHQNFPGQYRQIAEWLAAQGGNTIVFLTQRRDIGPVENITVVPYSTHRRADKDGYLLSRYFEDCMGAAYGAMGACKKLRDDGFTPDVVIGHVGWGELTFIHQVWRDVPVIGYWEYFFLSEGGSVGFDPEFPVTEDSRLIMKARNAINYLNLPEVTLGQSPTQWQMDTYPEEFRANSYVCHDGIRTDRLRPNTNASLRLTRLGRDVTAQDEVFTYMARNMEPTRGFHIFMRSLPHILDARPNARVLVIGGNQVSYGSESTAQGGYRAEMEREVGHLVDWDRIHFLGRLPFVDYQRVIQLSRCHIYLTVPFVLSWSLLECMAMQATIIASGTDPVKEVIRDGETGLLVDFLSPEQLAAKVIEVLSHPKDFAALGPAARRHVVDQYDFLRVTRPVHVERMNALVPRSLRIAI